MLSYEDIFNNRANLYHEAMQLAPHARDEEFDLLLELLDIQSTDIILDIPSGGDYLSYRLPKEITLISIDPSEGFSTIKEQVTNTSISNISFKDEYFDKIFSLSGLHHLEDKKPFFQEAHRVLKNGGTLGIADVAVNTQTASFLNEFINLVNPQGHTGIFLDNDTIEDLKLSGFEVTYEIKKLKWEFKNSDEMGNFCKLLFGATCDLKTIKRGLYDYMEFNMDDNGKTLLNWELLYIKAIKL